ncbi:TraR/DksA C4-type zinc finger protein, partial [bacterium]|nr:TraR/DksA C4-type zinc finger protein [bacterium]
KAPANKKVVKKAAAKKPSGSKRAASSSNSVAVTRAQPAAIPAAKPGKMTLFLKAQRQKLLDLRDSIADQMSGITADTRGAGSESAFGMHQADAGTDAYDRDFALSLLAQEQDAVHEIDEALNRIRLGTYGICEQSGERIMNARLEAMPFARLTVACQEKIEAEENQGHHRAPVAKLFGLDDRLSPKG